MSDDAPEQGGGTSETAPDYSTAPPQNATSPQKSLLDEVGDPSGGTGQEGTGQPAPAPEQPEQQTQESGPKEPSAAEQPPEQPSSGGNEGEQQPPAEQAPQAEEQPQNKEEPAPPSEPPAPPQSYDQQPAPAPQQPAEQAQQAAPQAAQRAKKIDWDKVVKEGENAKLMRLWPVFAAIILIIGAVLFLRSSNISFSTTTTTTIAQAVTTAPPANLQDITGCTTIDAPGEYFLVSNVNTSIQQGACIKVTASNVRLVGNGNHLAGEGPFTGTGPFTYGIELDRVSNVTVTGFRIALFSYAIFMNGSTGSAVVENNVTASTLSGIYMVDSSDNIVQGNKVTNSDSKSGVYLESGGGNSFVNDTVTDNPSYGIILNSTGNSFRGDILARNELDFACNQSSGLVHANNFSGTTCSTNKYCEFAHCSVNNTPLELYTVPLQSSGIRSCGVISVPGNYILQTDLSTRSYLNNASATVEPCITIASPDVSLDCNGRTISDSGIGVAISSAFNPLIAGEAPIIYNVSVSGCEFSNNTYGVIAEDSASVDLSNITAIDSKYGIYILNSSSGRIANVTASGGVYGVYLGIVNGYIVDSVKAVNNTYGIYMESGAGNQFNGGTLSNNRKMDFYCPIATYNSTSSLAQKISCGLTDCDWVSCAQSVEPNMKSYPVDGCETISQPGNYSLRQNLITKGTCFTISTGNVTFNCGGRTIIGDGFGSAFSVSGESNVSISDCEVNNFQEAVNASDTSYLNLNSIDASGVTGGVSLNEVSLSNITDMRVTTYSGTGFIFTGLDNSTVANNIAMNGTDSDGFIFTNAKDDTVRLNSADSNAGYGFALLNASMGNKVYNNTAYSNGGADYYCSAESGGVYAQPLAIDSGLTKSACKWLVLLPQTSQNPSCQAISSGEEIRLQNDMIYSAGATCFTVRDEGAYSADGTTIDCQGHTVLATDGGTFADVINATDVEIKNCQLMGFGTAIISTANSTDILNNTITGANTSISLEGSGFPTVNRNSIWNGTYGIAASGVNFASLLNNKMMGTLVGIRLSGGSAFDIENNTASNGEMGLYLGNTTASTLKDNVFSSDATGITCEGAATLRSSANQDLGGNICSGDSACNWMAASSQCTVS